MFFADKLKHAEQIWISKGDECIIEPESASTNVLTQM